MAEKPRLLVLGGCGVIGRNLVAMLVERELCSLIRVVDKTLPALAFLAPDHAAAFKSPSVEFVQGDLARQAVVDKVFGGDAFQYVLNLTYDGVLAGQTDEVYQQRVVDLSVMLGSAAAKMGVKRFVELSTGQVYTPNEKPATEADGKLKPWTKQAAFKLKAEESLRQVQGLPLVVIRPATVYGRGDTLGLSPRVLCAAVYKKLNEKMKFLWDSKLRVNTVHVSDVSAALWNVCTLEQPQPVFNLADQSDSTQGSIGSALEQLFGISVGFAGTVASTAAKAIGLRGLSETANEKHMDGWAALCKDAAIANTPLTAYIDSELLAHNHLAVNGRMIETTGFKYAVPQLTAATLREQVDTYVQQGLFPPMALGA